MRSTAGGAAVAIWCHCRVFSLRGTLFAYKPDGMERAFILYLAALIFLIIANAFPFLTLKAQGMVQPSHLLSGAIDIARDGMPEVGIAVVLFVIGFPLAKILIGLAVVGPLAFGRRIVGANALYRLYERLHPWAMTEIFFSAFSSPIPRSSTWPRLKSGRHSTHLWRLF